MRFRRKQRVAVVTNPNAGKNTPRAGLGKMLASILATPYHIYDTKDRAELDAAARKIRQDRPDILVIAGGDGTLQTTLTAFLRQHEHQPSQPLPQILIIPIGTMNNVATSLGLTYVSARDLAERIAYKIENGIRLDTRHLNPLKVNDEYCFLYGSGIAANVLERYYEGKPDLGPKRAVKVVLSTIWEELVALVTFRKVKNSVAKQVHATVRFPDHDPPNCRFMTHTGLMAATVDQVGLGCRALPLAMSKPDHFMLRSTALSFWGLVAGMPALWAGLPLPSTFDAVVKKAVIEYEQPAVRTVDGEMRRNGLVDTISCGPLLEFVTG